MKSLNSRIVVGGLAILVLGACGGSGSTPCLQWNPIQVTNPVVVPAGSTGTTAVTYNNNGINITDFVQKLTIGTTTVTASRTGVNTITAGVHSSVPPGLYTVKMHMDAVANSSLPMCPDQPLTINVLVPGIPTLCERDFLGSWTATGYPTGVGGWTATTTNVGPNPTERTHNFSYSTPGFHHTYVLDKSSTLFYQPQLQGAIGHVDASITGKRIVGTTFKQCDCMFALVQNGKIYVTSSFSTNGTYVTQNWSNLTPANFYEFDPNTLTHNLSSHPDFSATAPQLNVAVLIFAFGEHAYTVGFEFDDVCATFYP